MEPAFFADAAELRAWFLEHHAEAAELLVGYYKKHTGKPSVQHTEAIGQALCFGWIDSIGRRIDDERHQVRFTPRRKGSVWSAVNVAKVAEMTAAGLMHPAGLWAFESRKPERMAVYSYEQPADAVQTARFRGEEAAPPLPDRYRPTSPGGDVNLYSWPRLAAGPPFRVIRPWRHPSR